MKDTKTKVQKLTAGTLFLVLGLAACGNKDSNKPNEQKEGVQVVKALPQSQIETLIAQGEELESRGQYTEARKLFEKVLSTDRSNLRALRGAKLVDVSESDYQQAQALMKQAKNQVFLGHQVRAYRTIKKAATLDPNSEKIATLRGSSALLVHRFHEARDVFKKKFEADPTQVDSLIGWAEASYGNHDFADCLVALDNMQLIEAAAESNPRIANHLCELWYTKGVAASALFRYAEAIDVLGRATKREPNRPRYRDALAAAQLEAGNFENALVELKQLERVAPQTPLLHYRQGKALERLGRVQESVLAYREELRRDQSAWRVTVDCARAYEALGGRDNLLLALSFLDLALKTNPRSHEALFTQQAVYRKLGNKDESKRVNQLYQAMIEFKSEREKELRGFQQRINADPQDVEARLGMIAIRSRFNTVEDVLRDVYKLLNAVPNQPEGLWHLINLLLVQNKNQEAYYKATLFMDTAPNDSRGGSLAATALMRLNRFREALPLAREAFARDPRNGSALEATVLCLQKLDPQGAELRRLLPQYKQLKAEESRALKNLEEKEKALNRALGR